ncbi:MAG: metallophosphoesterase, partial [Saprospiraceae bacterium]
IEIGGFKWSPIQYRYPKWAGLYEENGRNLYINRGFGVLGFRGRAGIWPEITQIVLRREA